MSWRERVAGLPREAVLETKRRTQLERDRLWGFLFEDEQRAFRPRCSASEPEPWLGARPRRRAQPQIGQGLIPARLYSRAAR